MARNPNGNPAAVMLTSGASGRINALLSLCLLRSLWLLLFCCHSAGGGGACQRGRHRSLRRKVDSVAMGKVVSVPVAMLLRKIVDKEVAALWALAINRVMEDSGGRGDGETIRNFSLFVTPRGDTIFTQS